MERNKPQIFVRLHKLLDLILTSSAFIAAYFIKLLALPETFRGLTTDPNYYVVLLLIIIIWYQTFKELGLYDSYRRKTLGDVHYDLIKGVGLAFILLLVAMFLLRISDVSRILLGIFLLLDICLLAISKSIIYRFLHKYLKHGYHTRNILVIGSRERARQAINTMQNYEDIGYCIIGCLELDKEDIGKEVTGGMKVIDTVDQIPRLLRNEVVDEIIFAMRLKKIENVKKYIAMAETLGVTVRIMPDWQIDQLLYRPEVARVNVEDFLGVATMTMCTTPEVSTSLHLKTIFDYVFASVSLVVLSPLLLLIGLAIKLKSPGPVLYTQERCGLNGRIFRIFKFRTMVIDADKISQDLKKKNEADGPAFKIRYDSRIIPGIGFFLRKTGLDEIAQLINILRGEMSLIGPRPPIPAEVSEYEPWQMRRLSMKPGITGIWQTTPNRNDVSFDEWMDLDLKYIDNWNLLLDGKIFMKTVLVMMTGMGR